MGLLPEQKITVVLRMLAYGASANQVDEIARMGKSTILQSPNEVLWSNRIYLHHRVPPATYSHGLGKASEESRDASVILEVVASFDTWIWHAFFEVPEAQNDLNILAQSPMFNDVLQGKAPKVMYEVNGCMYNGPYYLADGIYPRWSTFVKTMPRLRSAKEKHFASCQEGCRKDVEHCFELVVIAGVAALIFGPKKLPEVGNPIFVQLFFSDPNSAGLSTPLHHTHSSKQFIGKV
ncbi:uncharacterized protein [Malus domestica]|uniref:uncharacterized protein n=1 Tax=Malus domestica TaxID=3750 RepID=UPI003975F5BB